MDAVEKDLEGRVTGDILMTVEQCFDICRPSFMYFGLQVCRSQDRVTFFQCVFMHFIKDKILK